VPSIATTSSSVIVRTNPNVSRAIVEDPRLRENDVQAPPERVSSSLRHAVYQVIWMMLWCPFGEIRDFWAVVS
jgi:hypothetical protein